MKTLPAGIAAHYQQGTTTLAYALLIVREDTQTFGFTSASEALLYEGVVYSPTQGLDVSSIEWASGFQVDNLELSTLDDGTLFTKFEVLGGVWRNAAFKLFRYNAYNIADGIDVLMVGNLGEVTLRNGSITVEMRGLQQFFQQPLGAVVTPTCRARLGDALCGVDLTPWTHTGSITSAPSVNGFTDSTKTQVADYFGEGTVTFTSGDCSGMSVKIKTFASGAFVLQLPLIVSPAIGDTYTAVAGCRKRFTADCTTKFSNSLNFQGEPHVPGLDKAMAPVGRRSSTSSSGGS